MQYGSNTVEQPRTASEVAGLLRTRVAGGEVAPGDLMPGVRRISTDLGVSPQTAHRALRKLASEGLLLAEPSRGYRVLPGANDPAKGCPVAFVLETFSEPGDWTGSTHLILDAFNRTGDSRGWSVVSMTTGRRTLAEVVQQLKSARASGAALDVDDPEIVAAIREAGVPAVQVNAWHPDAGIDSVMQDGQMAGLLAARHLAQQGCRRVAWIGRYRRRAHSMDRLSGAMVGCDLEGLTLPPSRIVKLGREDQLEKARKLLSRKDRPDGVIAPFRGAVQAVKTAAEELGLRIGSDLHLVGWSIEEGYETGYRRIFGKGPVAPAVTWSAKGMAEAAISRLAERRANPELQPVRVKIPVRLRLAE